MINKADPAFTIVPKHKNRFGAHLNNGSNNVHRLMITSDTKMCLEGG
jgi:hypothetical protein